MPVPSPSRPVRALRRTLALGAGLALVLGSTALTASAAEPAEDYVVITTSENAAESVADQVDGQAVQAPDGSGVDSTLVAAELTGTEADRLEDRSDVRAVVKDVRLRMAPTVASSTTSDASPRWGLDRIDQRSRTLDGQYRTPTTGAGTVVVVVDSGINHAHQEFTGRILTDLDWDFVGADPEDLEDEDDHPAECSSGEGVGHGTHVAGIAAGRTYGVAPGAKILPLRVFDCDGYAWFHDLYYAFGYALDLDAELGERMVVNYSGGVYTDDLDAEQLAAVTEIESLVREVVAAGVPVVTAAGNYAEDACISSPGRVSSVINVAASDISDRRAAFSDRGRCADLFAPGVGIRSAWVGSSSASASLDGTSMAAPHVAGVVARFLEREPRASSGQVWGAVRDLSTWDVVSDLAGTPNRLVYSDVRFAAPGAPTSTALRTDHAGQSVLLSWKAPLRDNGRAVTGYRVTRSGTDSRGRGPESVLVTSATLSKTFRYLVPGRSYTFTVAAVNPVGTGGAVSRSTTVVAAPGRPAKPVVTSGYTTDSATSIKVDWSRPSGGEPSRYLVTVRRTSDGATKTVEVQAPTSWVKVTGLSRGKTYTATVRSVNVAGTSAASPASGSATAR